MDKPHGEANGDGPPSRDDAAEAAQPEQDGEATGAPDTEGTALGSADATEPSAVANGSAPAIEPELPGSAVTPDEVLRDSVTKPPLLASDALMEDLAPMNPARGEARLWCAGVGVGFLLLGGLSVAGLRPGGAAAGSPAFVLGAVALVAALTRVTYRQRAVAMVVLGALATTIGLAGSGPALGIAVGGVGWGAARAIAGTALPAALVFRSRYRAYAGARWLLVAAFAAALPSLGHAVARIALLDPHLGQLGALAVILATLASLSGFMGSETTGAGSSLAVAVVLAFAGDVLIGGLPPLDDFVLRDVVGALAASLAFAAASAMTSLGLFQILAWRLAADAARRINLHSRPKDRRDRPQSGGEWLT